MCPRASVSIYDRTKCPVNIKGKGVRSLDGARDEEGKDAKEVIAGNQNAKECASNKNTSFHVICSYIADRRQRDMRGMSSRSL